MASHAEIVAGSDRQAATHPEFSQMNMVLPNREMRFSGTYHAFKFAKYAERYLAEVLYRFNPRFDLSVTLVRLCVPRLAVPEARSAKKRSSCRW